MNTNKALNEAAEKYANNRDYIGISNADARESFKDGVTSDAAKQYWQEQLQLNNKQVSAGVSKVCGVDCGCTSGDQCVFYKNEMEPETTQSISFSADELKEMAEQEFELQQESFEDSAEMFPFNDAALLKAGYVIGANAILATLQQKSVGVDYWISVDERLPEDLQDVLGTYSTNEAQCGCEIVYYSHEDKKWLPIDAGENWERIITHWQSLPKPPINKQLQ